MGTQSDTEPPDGRGGHAARRRWSRGLRAALAIATLASLVVLIVWGDQVACHLHVAREGYSVPDLTGDTLEEARALVRPCIEIDPTIASRPAPDSRIVEQVPEPPAVLNRGRAVVQATLTPSS